MNKLQKNTKREVGKNRPYTIPCALLLGATFTGAALFFSQRKDSEGVQRDPSQPVALRKFLYQEKDREYREVPLAVIESNPERFYGEKVIFNCRCRTVMKGKISTSHPHRETTRLMAYDSELPLEYTRDSRKAHNLYVSTKRRAVGQFIRVSGTVKKQGFHSAKIEISQIELLGFR